LSTKIKTQISEKRRKKKRFGSGAGEIVDSLPEVTIELPREEVGESENTSSRKTRSTQEEQVLVPTSESSRRQTRKAHEK